MQKKNMTITICRRSITLKNGRVILAKNYGKEAFCFEVEEERPKKTETSSINIDKVTE